MYLCYCLSRCFAGLESAVDGLQGLSVQGMQYVALWGCGQGEPGAHDGGEALGIIYVMATEDVEHLVDQDFQLLWVGEGGRDLDSSEEDISGCADGPAISYCEGTCDAWCLEDHTQVPDACIVQSGCGAAVGFLQAQLPVGGQCGVDDLYCPYCHVDLFFAYPSMQQYLWRLFSEAPDLSCCIVSLAVNRFLMQVLGKFLLPHAIGLFPVLRIGMARDCTQGCTRAYIRADAHLSTADAGQWGLMQVGRGLHGQGRPCEHGPGSDGRLWLGSSRLWLGSDGRLWLGSGGWLWLGSSWLWLGSGWGVAGCGSAGGVPILPPPQAQSSPMAAIGQALSNVFSPGCAWVMCGL